MCGLPPLKRSSIKYGFEPIEERSDGQIYLIPFTRLFAASSASLLVFLPDSAS